MSAAKHTISSVRTQSPPSHHVRSTIVRHHCTKKIHAGHALRHACTLLRTRIFERPLALCYDPTAGPARSECADPAVAARTTHRPLTIPPLHRNGEWARGWGLREP